MTLTKEQSLPMFKEVTQTMIELSKKNDPEGAREPQEPIEETTIKMYQSCDLDNNGELDK